MLNKHNSIFLKLQSSYHFDVERIHVGYCSYGKINVRMYGNAKEYLNIGNFCSFAPGTLFILGGGHDYRNISTFPFSNKLFDVVEASTGGIITICDDVWIGQNVLILSGITISQGAVVAAGAVVTHDIPHYAIAAGVPAKVIKYRFSSDIIDFLVTLDYSQLTEKLIREHIDVLCKPIDSLSLDSIKSLFSWFPKKSVHPVDL